jgi:hypothetical protein
MHDDQFRELSWDDDAWEGKATFGRFAGWGAALDEKDPPDAPPASPRDTSPTRAQVEAREQLSALARQTGGEQGALLSDIVTRFAQNMASPPPAPEPEDEEEGEHLRQLRRGTCDLTIDMDGKRAKPRKGQRAAWEALLARGDAVWDELLDQTFAIYQRQRPVRRKWWRAIYGDYLLDRRFPEVTSVEQFKRLIRPRMFHIKPPVDKKGVEPPDVTLLVMATWEVDGVGVVIRDGRIIEFGQVIDVIMSPPKPREAIDHPVFGRLRRIPSDDVMEFINEWQPPKDAATSDFADARRVATRPWQGLVRFDPLLDYASVASARAEYAYNRENADYPASRLAWEFADGQFEVRVYSPAGQPPGNAQAEAWRAFKSDEQRHAKDLIDAIFKRYRENFRALRANWTDRFPEHNIPDIQSPDGLRELIQLRAIHVHPPDADGRVTIAFQFVTSYDYDGLAAMWRGGAFYAWGRWKDAEFRI